MNTKSEPEVRRILQSYGDMLYRTAYLLLGNPHDVQDVLQEVLLRYLEKEPAFHSQDHEKAWLLRVTSNCCKDCLRFRKRHTYIDLEQLAVFIDHDLTPEEITAIGDKLAKISDISSYRYVNGDQAWREFKTAYFDDMPELAESFDKNPLADSNNYEVSIKLNANTQAVRDQISGIDGVQLITTIRDLKEAGGTMK